MATLTRVRLARVKVAAGVGREWGVGGSCRLEGGGQSVWDVGQASS